MSSKILALVQAARVNGHGGIKRDLREKKRLQRHAAKMSSVLLALN